MTSFPNRRSPRSPLKAVLCDWAGTVVDFGSRAPVEAVKCVFEHFGVPVSTAEARGPMGMTKIDHLRALLVEGRIRGQWLAVHDEDPTALETLNRIYEAFLPIQRQLLLENSQLIPGCLESLDWCRRRGMRLGSSTGYVSSLMQVLAPVCRDAGLEFDALVCGDEVPAGRPAPWMCLENARRLNVFPMHAVVVVDDTPVGIQAGLNAGMWTVATAASGNQLGLSEAELATLPVSEHRDRIATARQSLAAAGAHIVINTIAELPAAVEQIAALAADGFGP